MNDINRANTYGFINHAKEGNVRLFAQFGGQGVNYWKYLQSVYSNENSVNPQSYVCRLVQSAAELFLRESLSPEARSLGLHEEKFDLMEWLNDESKTPDEEYRRRAPISYPLILLTQLCQYLQTASKIFPSSPIKNFKALWKGATGHSQGVIAAIVISTSEDEESFLQISMNMLAYLFWTGLRMQQCFSQWEREDKLLAGKLLRESSEGMPTPMAAIVGISWRFVQKQLEEFNRSSTTPVEIALINGPRTAPTEDQTRIPFSKRKPTFRVIYLGVSVPFHTRSYLVAAPNLIQTDLERLERAGKQFPIASNLSILLLCFSFQAIPVYSTLDGSDLSKCKSLMETLTRLQCVEQVDWASALKATVSPYITHVIDFGPGGRSGAGGLTSRLMDGTGVATILAGVDETDSQTLSQSQLFSSKVTYGSNWEKEHAPKLVQLGSGKVMVDTKFSRLLGKPPVMVAGMTPTTANEGIVAALTNGGFHGELAGGGQPTEQIFRERIENLAKILHPGEGIHLNILFLNPKQWGFQFPLALQMRREGIPIDSITVAAGIPSLENAKEILSQAKEAGLSFVSFKPGSVEAIRQVIDIARSHPDYPVVLQFTGGRAGGHHSFEDVHQPILTTYSSIRRQKNLILVLGSGIGDGKESMPYLTGHWSVEYGFPPMPFDGILVGSRVMVALEALTSQAAKDLIVSTPGVGPQHWERSYEDSAGGVITVISELGEPIHKIETRGIQLWREFDKRFFSLPVAEREKAFREHKDYIIGRINADYQKVYFGKKKNGDVADLDEMTYEEVSLRMIQLMFKKGQWIHATYGNRFAAFLRRTEERLSKATSSWLSQVQPSRIEKEPHSVLESFMEIYPQASTEYIAAEDIDYFLHLCKSMGKPVNFVPAIDKDFPFWFKKDSLWQSENLEMVEEEDVGRVCILQGPVAVAHSKKANEPIAEILEGIHQEIIDSLQQSDTALPEVDYLLPPLTETDIPQHLPGIKIEEQVPEDRMRVKTFRLSEFESLPTPKSYKTLLGGTQPNWWNAFLMAPSVIHEDKKKVPNYLSTLFTPRSGQTVSITYDTKNSPLKVFLFDPLRQDPSVEITREGRSVHVLIHHFPLPSTKATLPLHFVYRPDMSYAPLHRQLDNGNDLIKLFYSQLWFPSLSSEEQRKALQPYQVGNTFNTRTVVTREALRQFLDAVGVRSWVPPVDDSKLPVPVDFAIVACWEALIKTLFPKQIDASLLNLLHLSYSYQLLSKDSFYEGDTIDSSVEITEINNMINGKRVSAKGVLLKDKIPLIEISSQFFFPGKFEDFSNTFAVRSLKRKVTVKDSKSKAILESKGWFHSSREVSVGDILVFDTQLQSSWKNTHELSKVTVTGIVSAIRGTLLEPIGNIQEESFGVSQSSVEHYLLRFSQPVETIQFFEDGGYSLELPPRADVFRAPAEHETYAKASGDFNPIHTNVYVAAIAGLANPITHGMWTASHVRSLLQQFIAQSERVQRYRTEFLEKVSASEQLQVEFSHVGIKEGLKLVEIKVFNSSGTQVMKGSAEVEEPLMGFAFTGQGSAVVSMGMELYSKSPVAKHIWDAAEVHLLQKFGFSILEIVRKNPKELTIHFGGSKGQQIRKTYMDLVHEIHTEESEVELVPLFPEITETTESYTFRHPEGLLFATQFTQPALTLLEKAYFHDMQSKGLVSSDALFAGHSLGEYAALSAVANILSVESLVELVFIRGITMQNAVQRDAQGRSSFSMIAVNPQRVGPFFTPSHMSQLVDEISRQSNKLIEVVNYNVENYQYIVTGYNSNLEAFRVCLDTLKKNPKASVSQLVKNSLDQFTSEEFIGVQQGTATIPLPGIDVPFHSKFLDREVPQFREYLKASLSPSRIDVDLLEGKYIPNLTAKPFQATVEYAKLVIATRDSLVLKELLERDPTIGSPEKKQMLAYYLVVELLAFQFASPVRWIETQDYYFSQGVGRFVELGPGATLKGMALRTLASGKYPLRHRDILTVEQDYDSVHYLLRPTPVEKVSQAKVQVEAKIESPVVPVVEVAKPTQAPAAAPPIVDAPVSALETLRVLLALKLKKPLEEIAASTSIKDLVGGKSALQNEILGDLQKEFQGQEPESAAEITLQQLASQMGTGYQHLGAPALKQISRLVSSKMPGGFGMAEMKSVFIHALSLEPPSRIESIQQAREWLDGVVDSFGSASDLIIGYRSKSAASLLTIESGATSVVNSEELIKFQRQQEKLIEEVMTSYSKYLNVDPRQGNRLAEAEAKLRKELEEDLKVWEEEHGKRYAEGIRPKFDPEKIRRYNSYWNWGRQEAYSLYYDTLRENPKKFDGTYCQRVTSLINRGTPELVRLVKDIAFKASQIPNERVARHVTALANQIEQGLSSPPLFRLFVSDHRKPLVEIVDGKISYSEVPRPHTNSLVEFVREMSKGFPRHLLEPSKKAPKRGTVSSPKSPRRRVKHLPVPTHHLIRPAAPSTTSSEKSCLGHAPYLYLNGGSKPLHYSEFDKKKTKVFFSALERMATSGQTFQNKTALVTGCGKGSIGLEIVKALLMGGAKVIATTSSFSKETSDLYRKVYQQHGGKGSELIVFPFNQASTIDIKRLIDHIYSQLEVDLDFVLPFAAISETGRDITNIDSLSELSHRLMLTNLLRLIGTIKSVKESLGKDTRPTNIILPLSPNHGVFGGDGLYAESKAGQEALFNKWHSEGWKNYLSLTGAVIGWTRGTGLMEGNNIVAHGIEKLGVRTFNQHEMAFSIVALCSPEIVEMSHHAPLWADLTGGMALLPNLHATVTKLRRDTQMQAEISRSIFQEQEEDESLKVRTASKVSQVPVQRKAHFDFDFPKLPSRERLDKLRRLEGMVNLDKVVVVVGMGEVGPWGNARTRWEMESYGEFSLEGCIELAWIMGLIKYHSGTLPDGKPYIGWVDGKTGVAVKDADVKNIYEETILKNCGIREIEPELFGGYNPHKKEFHRQVVINEDMPPFEVISQEEADRFSLMHGEKVDVFQIEGRWYVQMKKGAELFVPSALRFDRFVAGQIPLGWSAARYGIPKEITDQVDPVTLYNLVSTVEAFVSAGIVDPYEFYEYVHVSEVGNTSGGGIGGMRSVRQTFRERMFELPVQADILQEIFINVMPAWVNMLLLSSSGPIKTPVGACATAAESIELGVETIQSGKAKVVIVGGYDDFGEESSYEFAQMKATSNAAEEVAKGRHPREMSRPTSDTRSGFMESHGAGTQVLASASLAVEMGLPIYSIVAFTATATDKAGRSVPAPGQGILTTARETPSSSLPPVLDLEYRKKQLETERQFIADWKRSQLEAMGESSASFLEDQAKRREKAAQDFWGNSFWLNRTDIAPLRGSLAVWGLTIDDLGVASFHGTSTKANDKNESHVTQQQMDHLGRRSGNALFTIFQKYLTGHPKGAAAAWMANGLVQTLLSGRVPPNRNADNIDPVLRSYDHLIFFNEAVETTGLEAGLLKSFGFGQASAEVLLIHPDYLLATLSPQELAKYEAKRHVRERKICAHQHLILTGKRNLVQVKTAPPYRPADESSVYLNPTARASYDPSVGSWQFHSSKRNGTTPPPSPRDAVTPPSLPVLPKSAAKAVEVTMREMAEGMRQAGEGIGVDVQLISEIPITNLDFLNRNFTSAELAYCCAPSDLNQRQSRLAGRWAAKEAVVKALSAAGPVGRGLWRGSAAPLKEIEILPTPGGPPQVNLLGYAKDVASALGCQKIHVTLSHSGDYALAQARAL